MDENKTEMVDHLMDAIMTLRTIDEYRKFFYDICSKEELYRISRRVLIAKLIVEGENYRNILKKTNTSNITISRLKTVMSNDESVLADIVKRI